MRWSATTERKITSKNVLSFVYLLSETRTVFDGALFIAFEKREQFLCALWLQFGPEWLLDMTSTDNLGRKVSPWAATEIGHGSGGGVDNSHIRKHFREEGLVISDFLKGSHPARKLGHMQVNYSDTCTKLSKFQETKPTVLTKPPAPVPGKKSKNTELEQTRLRATEDAMNMAVRQEQSNNWLKRMHNREMGRKAQVNEIMAGTAPKPKVELFPQKCTHTQILAMTGTLAAPRADIIPEPPLPRKKWLGEGVGWGSTPR